MSELLPFVPPAIAAQSGIPMELEVSVPMPADGSGEVKLSTIYQACPKLFAAEITPLNDSEVTLPVKLGGLSDEDINASSPFVPGKAFGASKVSESKRSQEVEEENPFWSPVSEPESDEPEIKTEEPVAGKSPTEEKPAEEQPSSKVGGFDEPYSPPAEKADSPENKDPVESGFSESPFGGAGDFVTLFSNEEPSSETPVEEERDPEPTTSWGSMFQPAQREPRETEETPDAKEAPAPGDLGDLSCESEESAETRVEEVAEEPDEELPVSFGFEEPRSSPEAPPEPKPQPVSAPEPAPEPTSDGSEPKVEEESPLEQKVEEEPKLEQEAKPEPLPKSEPDPVPEVDSKPVPPEFPRSEAPKPGIEWTSTPVPVPPEAPVFEKEEASVTRPVQGSGEDDLSDVELRAIFSTSERFTLAKLARKVVGLPGIAACALSGSGKVVQASKSEENQLGAGAHDMVEAVRNIAKMTGMDQARSFTMKTEFGVVSLFLEGDCCLSVNHSEGEFGPGIREKLIVIARSLHKLSD